MLLLITPSLIWPKTNDVTHLVGFCILSLLGNAMIQLFALNYSWGKRILGNHLSVVLRGMLGL